MKNRVVTSLILAAFTISMQSMSPRGLFPQLAQVQTKFEKAIKKSPQKNIKEFLESAFDQNQSSDTQSLEQELKQLYWSNRIDLVQLMNAKQSASKEERVALLQKELAFKYPNESNAFTVFASSLASEETKLQSVVSRISKKMSIEKSSSTMPKLNELLNTTTKLKTNLQILTNIVNKIIMG